MGCQNRLYRDIHLRIILKQDTTGSPPTESEMLYLSKGKILQGYNVKQ